MEEDTRPNVNHTTRSFTVAFHAPSQTESDLASSATGTLFMEPEIESDVVTLFMAEEETGDGTGRNQPANSGEDNDDEALLVELILRPQYEEEEANRFAIYAAEEAYQRRLIASSDDDCRFTPTVTDDDMYRAKTNYDYRMEDANVLQQLAEGWQAENRSIENDTVEHVIQTTRMPEDIAREADEEAWDEGRFPEEASP